VWRPQTQLPILMSNRWWLPVRRLRAFGATVHVHFFVLIATGLLPVLAVRNFALAVAAVISYLAIIFVHELGHAAVAHWLGYDVNAIYVGLIHGRCEYEHPDTEWEAALVSFGGAAAQFLVAVLVFSVATVLPDGLATYFGPIVVFLGYLNVSIALLNLAPVAALDGKTAWRVLPGPMSWWRGRARVRKAIRRASKRE
jgi:stage IV sporulation protein FB